MGIGRGGSRLGILLTLAYLTFTCFNLGQGSTMYVYLYKGYLYGLSVLKSCT